MRLNKRPFFLLTVCLLASACTQSPETGAPPTVSNVIDGVSFEAGNWEPYLTAGDEGESRGNHRAVVKVDSLAEIVWAHIPWRRNDRNPEEKAIIVVDAKTDETVVRSLTVRVDNESGDIVFQPNEGSDTYHVYYFPYGTNGGYYPQLWYTEPGPSADPSWTAAIGTITSEDRDQFPAARVESIQSVNDFHSFFPMEIIATQDEIQAFTNGKFEEFYLFPEDRRYSIRMRSFLPRHWVVDRTNDTFEGTARRGEYYAFQVGVWAPAIPLDDLQVRFSDFRMGTASVLSGSEFTCLNTEGVDLNGDPFAKSVSVPQGEIQPLWLGVQIPDDADPGVYSGEVTIGAEGVSDRSIRVNLHLIRSQVEDSGDNEPEKMSRLRWLNSTAGTDPDFIIDPFIPITIDERTIQFLGRDIILGDTGLPESIRSYFTPELTGFSDVPVDILARPIRLDVVGANGSETWISEPFDITLESRGRASWSARSRSESFDLIVDGAIEYEGMLDYRLTLVARDQTTLKDIVLPISMPLDAATYILGLGHKGQKRPAMFDWKWNVENHHEGVWLGNINRGLQYVLRDENYERPLNTNFYQQKPLNMPPSWENEGRGGIRMDTGSDEVRIRNYSGPRTVEAGDSLHFNIRFLITPFKPIDTKVHFDTRFVHKYVPVDSVKAWGGTVVNIHHANEINPYINYPFFNLDKQSAYIDEAHRKGIKVKLYDTIRELTYRAYELFALRSLGDEILNDGEGGGHSWLQEHLRDRYHSAWHASRVDDAAILNKGTSRWTNYYIEGLSWLAKNQKIDGLYLDDIAFSRETVKRMISVLNQHRDEVVIDLHSANQFNPRDGFINSAMLYMEHFPFISRLWFGEYFEYDKDEDYWMTEVSGLPFGLMGEMLQGGGHPYRGLLYGMTARMYGDVDPRPVWRMMNDFGIAESRMVGYWIEDNPVRSDNDKIVSTTYVRPDGVLIVLASWDPEDVNVRLEIDWDQLGFDASSAVLTAPRVAGLQEYAELDPFSEIKVPAQQGLFLVLTRR